MPVHVVEPDLSVVCRMVFASHCPAAQAGLPDHWPFAHVTAPPLGWGWYPAAQLNRHVLPACPLQLVPLPPAETVA